MGNFTIHTDANECRDNTEIENVVPEELQLTLSSQRHGDPSKSTCMEGWVDGARRSQSFLWDTTVGSSCFESGKSISDTSWCQEHQGTSSTQIAGMPLENDALVELGRRELDRDFQHKRLKILGCHVACHSFTTSGYGSESCNTHESMECNTPEGLPFTSENTTVIYYHSDNGCANNHMDSDVQGNGGDDSGNSDSDNAEVRIDLTEDLLHMVFSFLNHRDLCQAGATCKQWHAASVHEDFWRHLNFKDMNITPENFAAICHRYPNAIMVNVLGVPDFDVLVMEALASLRRLESLFLGQGHGLLGDSFFHTLTNCPSLKSLSITDASLGSSIQEIIIDHDTLHVLHIIKCRALRISVRCLQLQSLSLKRSSMSQVALSCPKLLELDISCCHKLSDAGIRSATVTCQSLTSLNMSFCSCVTDETLREIAFACPNLQVLDASYCPNVSFESVRFPMLRDLKLHSCEGISSGSVAALSHSYMLETLQLDCCSLLLTVCLDLPHLRSISLLHCRKIIDLYLTSPVLSSVKVSNCPVLHRISIVSNALKKLVLQKQDSLSTLSLQCNNLVDVDLTDCESLKNSVCDIFSDGGGCPMLQSLTLDNCESLTEVRLISSSLVNISLVGCRMMTTLELSSPNLQKINLDGCDHLEKALFCPVGLQSLNLGICPKLSFLRIEAGKMLTLELQGCGVLSKAYIDCPRLLSLDASFCCQLKDDSICAIAASCPLTTSLILTSCLLVGSNGLSSLSGLRYLTLLDLSYTFLVDLQPVFETCSQLKTLRLMACKYLTDSSLDALYKDGVLPSLCELDLSYSTASQSAIDGLLTWCTNLTNVQLNGCVNMHNLIWDPCDDVIFHCSRSSSTMQVGNYSQYFKPGRLLETLNCVGCPNIKKVIIPPSAHCFYLTRLNFHLSANLKEVNIACVELYSLDLSHCSTLEILMLNCPKLGILYLMACSMLSEAAVEIGIRGCRTLETLYLQDCPKIYPVNMGRLRVACPSLKRIHTSL